MFKIFSLARVEMILPFSRNEGGEAVRGETCAARIARAGREPGAPTLGSPQNTTGEALPFPPETVAAAAPALARTPFRARLCTSHPRPSQHRHLLHGFEQRLPVILERHDELQLSAPRLHGCGGKDTGSPADPPSADSEATSALAPTPDLGPWTWSGPPSAWEFGVSYKDADTCPPAFRCCGRTVPP